MRGNGSASFVELPFPPPLLFRANLLLDSFPNHRPPSRASPDEYIALVVPLLLSSVAAVAGVVVVVDAVDVVVDGAGVVVVVVVDAGADNLDKFDDDDFVGVARGRRLDSRAPTL